MTILKVTLAHEDAQMPKRATEGAGGLDLFSLEYTWVAPGSPAKIRTGLKLAIPEGYVGLVRPRSSIFMRGLNVEGVIDSDYRGEIFIMAQNITDLVVHIRRGDRVAQLVVTPVADLVIDEVGALPETARGSNGFGSTGR